MHQLPRLTTLIATVADSFNLQPEAILSKKNGHRRKTSSAARHVLMWVIRTTWRPQPSYPEIGTLLGFDHTTVVHATRRISLEVERKTEIGLLALQIALNPGGLRAVPEGTGTHG